MQATKWLHLSLPPPSTCPRALPLDCSFSQTSLSVIQLLPRCLQWLRKTVLYRVNLPSQTLPVWRLPVTERQEEPQPQNTTRFKSEPRLPRSADSRDKPLYPGLSFPSQQALHSPPPVGIFATIASLITFPCCCSLPHAFSLSFWSTQIPGSAGV